MTHFRPVTNSLASIPPWVGLISDSLDHYHGSQWSIRVLPNNYVFYVRDQPHQLGIKSVTHNIHKRFEFVVALKGEGRVCIEDRTYPFVPGQALLVKPGEFHRYLDVTKDFLWLFFVFDLGFTEGILPDGDPVRQLSGEDLGLLSEAGQIQSCSTRNEFDSFTVALKMGTIIRSMTERPAICPLCETEEDETTVMLRRVSRFVDRYLEDGVRIPAISDHLGISESSLRKLFRERVGVSLGAYLQHSRLSRAVQLIGDADLAIKDIARRCGFESIFSFSHAFAKAFGMPPSAYRRHLAEGGMPITINHQDKESSAT